MSNTTTTFGNRTGQARNAAAAEAAQKLAFLEAPALLPREPAEEYDAHLIKLTEQLQPADAIDEKLVRDLVHYQWTSIRYRKELADLIGVSMQEALETVLERLIGKPAEMSFDSKWIAYGHNPHRVLARHYVLKEPKAVKAVDDLLAQADLSSGAIESEAMARRMYEIERIDRMIRTADEHFHRVQREMERRRSERAKAAQRTRRAERQGEPGAPDAAVRQRAA